MPEKLQDLAQHLAHPALAERPPLREPLLQQGGQRHPRGGLGDQGDAAKVLEDLQEPRVGQARVRHRAEQLYLRPHPVCGTRQPVLPQLPAPALRPSFPGAAAPSAPGGLPSRRRRQALAVVGVRQAADALGHCPEAPQEGRGRVVVPQGAEGTGEQLPECLGRDGVALALQAVPAQQRQPPIPAFLLVAHRGPPEGRVAQRAPRAGDGASDHARHALHRPESLEVGPVHQQVWAQELREQVPAGRALQVSVLRRCPEELKERVPPGAAHAGLHEAGGDALAPLGCRAGRLGQLRLGAASPRQGRELRPRCFDLNGDPLFGRRCWLCASGCGGRLAGARRGGGHVGRPGPALQHRWRVVPAAGPSD